MYHIFSTNSRWIREFIKLFLIQSGDVAPDSAQNVGDFSPEFSIPANWNEATYPFQISIRKSDCMQFIWKIRYSIVKRSRQDEANIRAAISSL